MKVQAVILAVLSVALILTAAPRDAAAESPVTFSGYLRLRNIALGGFFPQSGDVDKASDNYFVSRLRVNVDFKPNDRVEIRWRFHGPHGARWGTTATRQNEDFSLFSQYFYGVVKTDWGTISVGRVSYDIDSAGLRTLGYAPVWGWNGYSNIFDRDSENDGIMYFNKWDNGFGLKAFYVKRAHGLPALTSGGVSYFLKDADYDRYSIEPFYQWDTGGVSLALQYDRNNFNYSYSNNIAAGSLPDPTVDTNYVVTVNPAFYQGWAVGGDKKLSVHGEFKYALGKFRRGPIGGVEQREITQDGFGGYLDLALDYQQGTAALAGWYFRGNDQGPGYNRPNDWRDHSLVDGGEGFYPFFLFYYGNNFFAANATRDLEGNQQPGHWAVALFGNHNINEFVTLNYGIGSFRKTNDYYLADGSTASRTLGTEVDVGLTVKVLDNLLWQTKVGVFDTGKYYSDVYGRSEFDRTLWGLANELLFTF